MNPALSGLIAAISWGTHDFAARFVARGVGYVNAVLGVTLTGIGWLGLWLLFSGETITWSGEIWLAAVSGGVFALATMWLFAALAIGPIAVVAPIVGAFPIYNVAFAVMQGAQRDILTWAAMAAVISGVIVVARCDPAAGKSDSLRLRLSPALLFAFASGFCFAVSFIVGQKAAVALGEVQTVFIGRFFGLAMIFAVLLRRFELPRLPRPWWPAFVGMGLLDALALVSVVAAGHTEEAEIATVVASAFGAVTVILARIGIKEPVSMLQWAGIVTIVAGVAVLTTKT